MEEWLPEAGIAYRWDKRLGGFRKPSAGNPDVAWREDMFRGYAEHMRSADFGAAVDAVLADTVLADTVLAEAVLAEAVLAEVALDGGGPPGRATGR